MLKKSTASPKRPPAAAANETSDTTNEYLGVRLRHARMTKGLRMRDVADAADCSESMISKIENGRAVPSLNALYRIAEVLELKIGQLFEKPSDPEGLLSRAGERPIVKIDPLRNGPGLTLERLIPFDKSRLLQGSIHNLSPGGSGGGLVTHEGEEVAYILEGQVELMIGEARYLLNAGDSICYRSEIPHGYKNTSSSPARFIIVNTPPTF